MILNIKERLMLIGMIPQEGTLSEMVDIYDLVKQLKLSDEEKDIISYKESSLGASWDSTKDPNKDIQLSKDQYKAIKKGIDKLDSQQKINIEQVPLIMKINYEQGQ